MIQRIRRARESETSESLVLENLEAYLQDALHLPVAGGAFHIETRELLKQVQRLQGQVGRGLHTNPARRRNPALVLYGNPGQQLTGQPGVTLSVTLGAVLGYIERLDYERTKKPVGLYFHEFGPADALWTGELADGQKVVLIANVKNRPLWDER